MSESTTNVITPVCTKIKVLRFGYFLKNSFRKGFSLPQRFQMADCKTLASMKMEQDV